MANLFSKSAIKHAIASFQGLNIDREIAIVQELYDDFRKGNMKDETRYEQNFNELFFHQLLGYDPKMNFHPKASTPVGSKIADVGLGFFTDGLYSYEGVKVVVELKGCETMLDKKQASYGGQSPVDQGFGYKTSFKDCPWLIVSNFASVRLYRDNKQDFELWTIEDLANPDNDYYHLKTLLALLKRNHLISASGTSYTETILSEVRSKQEQITKDFYKQYKTLRLELINDIRQHNTDVTVEVTVEKAQKIIDRIIFIHFCEDRGLLPEGKLKTNLLKGHEVDLTPWEVLKLYFRGVDKGSEKLGIPNGYNGGLFQEDVVLNNLEIGATICHKFIDLGHYNFDDELSVNILGHIFEQSISDIEQLKGELSNTSSSGTQRSGVEGSQRMEAGEGDPSTSSGGRKSDKKESKRKKDGIFYTPEYIVDYIVQNSLMTYLEEKENECLAQLGKKGGYKTEIEAYQAYQHILQQVKVLDPACGSGAFLVRVFDYLYAENKRVGQIIGSLFSTDEIYKSILRDNIYGVDLNPESVEITKLSLWLKSAQKGKKLNNLDANIKCGNSLIDDPAIAGERAFDWQKEFSDIMGAGGFDVIVGNPPYVRSRELFSVSEKQYYINSYKTVSYQLDLYKLFIEKSLTLVKKDGVVAMITPSVFLVNDYDKPIRQYIVDGFDIERICSFNKDVFDDATVKTVIFVIKNKNSKSHIINFEVFDQGITQKSRMIDQDSLKSGSYLINEKTDAGNQKVIQKIAKFPKVGGFFTVKNGIKVRKELLYDKKIDNNYKHFLLGRSLKPYSIEFESLYIHYLQENEKLYTNQAFRNKEIFETEKILVRQILGNRIYSCYDDNSFYVDQKIYVILKRKSLDLKYLNCILSSKLLYFYYANTFFDNKVVFPQIKGSQIAELPIPEISLLKQQPFIDKADLMLSLNTELHDKIDFVLRFLQQKYSIEKLSTKLSRFRELDFAHFIKELKVKLSMTDEAELMRYFDQQKAGIVSLKNRIDATDREIDAMVFELYGLSEEEREVVRG